MHTLRLFKRLNSTKVGAKFTNINEINSFLKQYTWSLDKLIPEPQTVSKLPSKQEVSKLLKLSGLPQVSDTEMHEIQHNLATQIRFVDHLQSVCLANESEIDPKHARIVPRINPNAYTIKDLLQSGDKTTQSASLGEVSDSWDPTGLASITRPSSKSNNNRFFVLREGLITNRD